MNVMGIECMKNEWTVIDGYQELPGDRAGWVSATTVLLGCCCCWVCCSCRFAISWRRRSAASSRAVIALSSSFNFSFSCVSFNTLLARFCIRSTLQGWCVQGHGKGELDLRLLWTCAHDGVKRASEVEVRRRDLWEGRRWGAASGRWREGVLKPARGRL